MRLACVGDRAAKGTARLIVPNVVSTVTEQFAGHRGVVVLAVAGGIDDRQRTAGSAGPQLGEAFGSVGELVAVARAKLGEAGGNVVEPLAQLVAGCQVARPVVEARAFARDAAWPYVIDQHPVAVVRLGRVVDALGSHVRRHRGLLARVGDDASPKALGAPDIAAQAPELNDLAVVDEQIDLGAVVLDVPAEDLGIGGLKHHLLHSQLARDRRDGVGAPGRDLLGDALGLDHDHVGAGVQAASRDVDGIADVAGALLLELFRGVGAAGAGLDANLGFGLEAGALNAPSQAQDVVGGDADEAGRDLEDVKPHPCDLVGVALTASGPWGEDVLDEASRGDDDVVLVRDLDDLPQRRARASA